MKTWIAFLTLTIVLPAWSAQPICPTLSGSYFCVFKQNQFSPLVVKQWTKKNQQEIAFYSFDYTRIPGEPEITRASEKGEPDGQGWITRCKKGRLMSVTIDGSRMSEIYLDRDHAINFSTNGQVTQICPEKKKIN